MSEPMDFFLKSLAKKEPTKEQKNCWKTFLSDLMSKPDSIERKSLIKNANAKDYHDYQSCFSCPKMLLKVQLQSAGYDDMADKVLKGDYDF